MKFLKNNLIYLAWATSLAAVLSSLYFSEVRHFPPCLLCWYQRICMYPLVAIIAIGILKKDRNLAYYVLPLSLVGMGIAIYHNLLYYKILPENAALCAAGISCTSEFIQYFGFITIPFLSFLGFLFINIVMLIHLKSKND